MRGLALSMLLALGAMVGAAAPAGTAAAQASQAIGDPALGFTAKLPGAASKTVTAGAPGDAATNVTSWIVESPTAAYSVTVLEFRAGAFSGQDPVKLLSVAIDGGVKAVSGVETTTLAGLTAVEAQFNATLEGSPMIGRVIMALKGDILYGVMTLEPASSTDAAYRQAVRDFKLL